MNRVVGAAAVAWIAAVAVAMGQSRYAGTLDQHPAIDYRGGALSNAVTMLARDIKDGKASLTFDGQQGFLRSLLARLNVPVESQLLLFSKTGIQNAHTSPETPRAVYFNDRVIVGYILGAPVLEIASHDPRQGVIFQTLKQDAWLPGEFARPDRCLGCHLSANSLDVPGVLVRSMFAAGDGRAMPQLGSFVIDHRSPLEQRWGGWYVTGTHGGARHMGYAFVADSSRPESAITDATLNRSTLDARVNASAYPGPKDRAGRSLRELDLQSRLFKYRCRYMIYSPAFDSLPVEARAALLARIEARLTDRDTLAILDETKPGWRS